MSEYYLLSNFISFLCSACQIKNDVGRCYVLWKAYRFIGNAITMKAINPYVSDLKLIQNTRCWAYPSISINNGNVSVIKNYNITQLTKVIDHNNYSDRSTGGISVWHSQKTVTFKHKSHF